MRKLIMVISFFLALLLSAGPAVAQSTDNQINQTYQTGTVTRIIQETEIPIDGQKYYVQEVEVKGSQDGQLHTIISGSEFTPLNANQRLKVGAQVIISLQQITDEQGEYVINDVYRLPVLALLAVLFIVLVVIVGGKQGTLSIAGMLFSLVILISFIVPHILNGENPLVVTLLGATITAVITMYLSHGWKRQTHIALASMIICLGMVAILANLAVHLGHLVGLGSEEAAFLQFGPTQKINLQGLLLAGILLGALGILDDITLAQTSVIEQLKAVHPKITFAELYNRGLAVGKDHVASLVNTLVFAYAGTSLPLFLLFTLYRTQPSWVIVNMEVVAEEIVRTLVGSIGLVMAVPITTLIAAYYVSRSDFKLTPAEIAAAKTDRAKPHGHSH